MEAASVPDQGAGFEFFPVEGLVVQEAFAFGIGSQHYLKSAIEEEAFDVVGAVRGRRERSEASRRATVIPVDCRDRAQLKPARPAPTTTTSIIIFLCDQLGRVRRRGI